MKSLSTSSELLYMVLLEYGYLSVRIMTPAPDAVEICDGEKG